MFFDNFFKVLKMKKGFFVGLSITSDFLLVFIVDVFFIFEFFLITILFGSLILDLVTSLVCFSNVLCLIFLIFGISKFLINDFGMIGAISLILTVFSVSDFVWGTVRFLSRDLTLGSWRLLNFPVIFSLVFFFYDFKTFKKILSYFLAFRRKIMILSIRFSDIGIGLPFGIAIDDISLFLFLKFRQMKHLGS